MNSRNASEVSCSPLALGMNLVQSPRPSLDLKSVGYGTGSIPARSNSILARGMWNAAAFHMPRARMLFERAGIEPVPYPTDFRSSDGRGDWTRFIPSASGLHETSEALREFIGRIYYRAIFSFDT